MIYTAIHANRNYYNKLLLPAVLYLLILLNGVAQDTTKFDTDANQIPNTKKFFSKNYFPIDYAGQNQMYDIIQDSRGVMYFGNNVSGILEYDGIHWRTIPLANNNTAYGLAKDKNGKIYVSGYGEIGYLNIKHGVSSYVSLMDKVPEEYKVFGPSQVKCIENRAYFKAGNIILRCDDGIITAIKNSEGEAFETLFVANNKIYTSDEKGNIFKIEDDKATQIFQEHPAAYGGYLFKNDYNLPGINLILPFDGTKILIRSLIHGLLIFDESKLDLFETEINELLVGDTSYAGMSLGNEYFAFGTITTGVIIIDKEGKTKALLDENNSLINNGVFSVYADNQNFLWIGTSYGFSQVLFPSPFSVYDHSSGLEGQVRMTANLNDDLYVATSVGVYKTTPESSILGLQFSGLDALEPAETGTIKSFGTSIIIGNIAGLFVFEDIRNAQLSMKPDVTKFIGRDGDYIVKSFIPLHEKDCRFVEVSKKYPGIIYAAAVGEGLFVFRNRNGKWIQEGHVAIEDSVFFGQEDTEGVLWIAGINSGSYSLDFSEGNFAAPHVKNYYTNVGLPEGYYVTSVAGENVFMYSDEAFFKFDPIKKAFVSDKSFFSDPLLTGFIDEKPNGNVWITKGRPRKLSLAIKKDDNSYSRKFSPFQRFNNYQIRNFGYDTKGLSWFGSEKSLLAYDANESFDYEKPFKTILRRITVNDMPVFGLGSHKILRNSHENPIIRRKGNTDTFHYDDNSLRFDYAGLYIDVEFSNQYQVKLDGLKASKWSNWSEETYKEFGNVNPGEYVFRVKSKNLYGTRGAETTYRFKILPPWWETWWFYASEIGILMTLLIASIVLNRTGEASRFSKTVTLVTIVVIFESFMIFVEQFAENYGGSIPVFQLALNICLALALGPAEELLEKLLIGQRRRRKYKLVFEPNGDWNGGAQLIPTLKDMSNLFTWIEDFDKEFEDVGRKYGRYISNDWSLDDAEIGDLAVELEDLLGGLFIFRQSVTKGNPNELFQEKNQNNFTYKIAFYRDYWKGSGKIPADFDFTLEKFVDWYEDMIKNVAEMFLEYGKAMEDNVLTDDERNATIMRIEDIIYNVLLIIKALLLRRGDFGQNVKPKEE